MFFHKEGDWGLGMLNACLSSRGTGMSIVTANVLHGIDTPVESLILIKNHFVA